jgi:hypothetical protein
MWEVLTGHIWLSAKDKGKRKIRFVKIGRFPSCNGQHLFCFGVT